MLFRIACPQTQDITRARIPGPRSMLPIETSWGVTIFEAEIDVTRERRITIECPLCQHAIPVRIVPCRRRAQNEINRMMRLRGLMAVVIAIAFWLPFIYLPLDAESAVFVFVGLAMALVVVLLTLVFWKALVYVPGSLELLPATSQNLEQETVEVIQTRRVTRYFEGEYPGVLKHQHYLHDHAASKLPEHRRQAALPYQVATSWFSLPDD